MRSAHRAKMVTVTICFALAGCGASVGLEGAQGSFERYSYTNEFGTRTYKVYVPTRYYGDPMPLIVQLHGCSGNADEEARWSRFNLMAERYGFLVAYPEQTADNSGGATCWTWYVEEHQERDSGEASIIAGITREVMARWSVDAERVYVGGISAGGAMANVMTAAYPDLYAAAMIYAGCQYKGGPSCLGAQGTLSDEQAGDVLNEAMGEYARVVPVIAIVGEFDQEAPAENTEQVVQQHLANDDLVDDGQNNDSVATTPGETEDGEVPGGHAYSIDRYRDESGCLLAERWFINGMAHAWSRGQSTGSARDQLFTDPNGPDVSTATVEFFLAHPMPPDGGVQCHQAGA